MSVDTAPRSVAQPSRDDQPAGRQPRAGMVGSGHGGHWWLYLILVVALVAVIAPFVWMILGSFKSEGELRQVPPTWWPETASLDNYTQLFSRLNFGQFFFNSAVVAVVVTVGNLVFCSMLGYALAMLDFKGKKVIFVAVMATLMIPGVVTFVPLFVLVANAGLVDTLPGLFLPFLVSPFGVFLMRQFIIGLPKDLLDAGRVDGAGELTIFARIIMPLCGPALATLGILTFLGSWNNFLWPLVVAQSEEKYTLPVALALYSTGQNSTNYGLLLAGATVVIIPILLIFLIFQRKFIEGIATTGLK
ncbi:carbohydrate ABC transporter permease [Humibacillus xanthopallidus]|uniref:Carbohydrate ABC transporter membrane protein 2 (CUT1 family) n=1 Tax=Humibacillus xanthopallidus TaxID=412689 RepID=A0A543HFS6_9MICO|nr:carbohydrate ABC transporter permease [Humibacillus xanthopallidus]TQM57186.1 carbohydrate ABC transporter membrane protein 2 (CUT1 family) [Humibacillus xanthopallidus]